MANEIFIRVELHEHPDGSRPDYEVLEAYMARQLFSTSCERVLGGLASTGMYVSHRADDA